MFSMLNFTFLVLRKLTSAAKKDEGKLQRVAWKLRDRKYLPWVHTQARLLNLDLLSVKSC